MSTPYQPKTGQPCHCKRGQARNNCPDCEGTGQRIDFKAIRARAVQECSDRVAIDRAEQARLERLHGAAMDLLRACRNAESCLEDLLAGHAVRTRVSDNKVALALAIAQAGEQPE